MCTRMRVRPRGRRVKHPEFERASPLDLGPFDTIDTLVLGGSAELIAETNANDGFNFPHTRIVAGREHTPQAPDELSVVMTRILGHGLTDIDSISNAYAKEYEQIPQLSRSFWDYVPGCTGGEPDRNRAGAGSL